MSDDRLDDELLRLHNGDLRMDAYYYGFDPTGVLEIDRVLAAVAVAGKRYHSTEEWGNAGWNRDEPSCAEIIQSAANAAAVEVGRLRVADTALRAALDAIDHATYGWSFATAVQMVDKIRLIARETLAAAAALQEPQHGE